MKIMNPLARWNQLNELEDQQHTLRSLFSGSRAHSCEDRARVQFIPLVDISEDAQGYLIKAELPQVKKEDVKITLEGGTLTITGERKFDQNSEKDHPLALAHGRFAHSFTVPNDARPIRAKAVFKNGVLTVHLARNEKAKHRHLGQSPPSAHNAAAKGLARPVHPTGNNTMTRTIRN